MSAWPKVQNEPRGKRPKVWCRAPDGGLWLRKEPARSPEPAIEALALRLAESVGLPAPSSFPCTWTDNGTLRKGIVIRSFLQEGVEDLSLGTEVLRAVFSDYEPQNHSHHTLERVADALRVFDPPAKVIEPFARMLTFDAWIGNGDRHQENWGLIFAPGRIPRLAPVFDPAACLGGELQDDHACLDVRRCTDERVEEYLRRCPSGFGIPGRKKLLLQEEVLGSLETWATWRAQCRAWVAPFATAMDSFEVALDGVSDEWLSRPRREFAKHLLRRRYAWLMGRLP